MLEVITSFLGNYNVPLNAATLVISTVTLAAVCVIGQLQVRATMMPLRVGYHRDVVGIYRFIKGECNEFPNETYTQKAEGMYLESMSRMMAVDSLLLFQCPKLVVEEKRFRDCVKACIKNTSEKTTDDLDKAFGNLQNEVYKFVPKPRWRLGFRRLILSFRAKISLNPDGQAELKVFNDLSK